MKYADSVPVPETSQADLDPLFVVKAIVFPGDNVDVSQYIDNEDIEGNLHHVQNEQGVNSLGKPEIPPVVIEELLVNALIHRDYFISAPIRLFIFRDRIELIFCPTVDWELEFLECLNPTKV